MVSNVVLQVMLVLSDESALVARELLLLGDVCSGMFPLFFFAFADETTLFACISLGSTGTSCLGLFLLCICWRSKRRYVLKPL